MQMVKQTMSSMVYRWNETLDDLSAALKDTKSLDKTWKQWLNDYTDTVGSSLTKFWDEHRDVKNDDYSDYNPDNYYDNNDQDIGYEEYFDDDDDGGNFPPWDSSATEMRLNMTLPYDVETYDDNYYAALTGTYYDEPSTNTPGASTSLYNISMFTARNLLESVGDVWEFAYLSLLLLESIKKNRIDVVGTLIEDPFGNKSPESFLKKHDISGTELWTAVNKSLDHIVHIDVSKSSGVKVNLRDWRHHWIDMQQQFIFEVIVPYGVTDVHIDIYSAQLVRMLTLLQSFRTYYETLNNNSSLSEEYKQQLGCNDSDSRDTIKRNVYNYFKESIKDHYSKTGSVTVDTRRGSNIELKPFHNYQINLMPTGHFISHLKNCYDGTYENCVDECHREHSEDKCNCHPWGLHYLDSETGNICQGSCILSPEESNKCRHGCAEMVVHPCNLTLYHMQVADKYPIKHVDGWARIYPNKPMYSIQLQGAQSLNHPRFIEKDEMTIGNYMAQLGGLVDFWLGVNVIGIVHMIIFLLRNCKHAMDKDHKTGRNLRRIFGIGKTVSAADDIGTINATKNDYISKETLTSVTQEMDQKMVLMEDHYKQEIMRLEHTLAMNSQELTISKSKISVLETKV